MDSEQSSQSGGHRPEALPSALDRQAADAVRRWLEDCWRHGELLRSDDIMRTGPSRPVTNRFTIPSGPIDAAVPRRTPDD
jgi:hypothetical protein